MLKNIYNYLHKSVAHFTRQTMYVDWTRKSLGVWFNWLVASFAYIQSAQFTEVKKICSLESKHSANYCASLIALEI